MSPTRTYTKVARAAAEEQTRTALLDAATEAFFSKRWEDITLTEVASAAGVTKQTLLRHFGSKEGLMEAGFARAMDAVGEQRLDAPTDDIAGAVDNLLDHYEELGDRALRIEAMDGVPAVARFVDGSRRFHHEWVDHAFGAWLQPGDPVRPVLIALCDVHAWRILTRDLGLSRADVHASLVLSIRRLLKEPS